MNIEHGSSLCRNAETGDPIVCREHDLGIPPMVDTQKEIEDIVQSAPDKVESTVPDLELVVPPAFWEDHVDRGCRCHEKCPDREKHESEYLNGGPEYGVRTSKGYRVVLSDLDVAELLSDARHYSDCVQTMGPEFIGLQSSARATVRRIEAAKLDNS